VLALSLQPHVRCRTLRGYQREPLENKIRELADLLRRTGEAVLPPPLLNARGHWTVNEADAGLELRAYDAAAIITGQEMISAYWLLWAEDRTSVSTWVCVSLDLALPIELAVYEALHGTAHAGAPARRPSVTLKVGCAPIQVEFLSEPYVVHTRRGYATMVTVRELSTGREKGLYVQASSLATPLEGIRSRRGRLTGSRVELVKESEAQYALYVVEELLGK
jgi:hypothetical protein